MMELHWTPEAVADRNAIYDYIEPDNPAAALALDELFDEQADHLIKYPLMGRQGREAGTREWVVHQNYILVYDAHGETVRVLRVLHAARRWPPLK
jgi:addiction module RelE/StbE family toxin